ncbi:MAG: trypsin-like peptidase domain-containing protein [Sphingosinicella sp.]|nr:trypsin-like peptidase domain-containing protein [Sphingosinicella sp.]
MRLNLHNQPHFQKQFSLVEERFNLLFANVTAFNNIVAAGLKFMRAPHAESKIGLMKQNFFSKELLQAMICGGESYRMEPVNFIWRRLLERDIVIRQIGHMPGAFVDHALVLPVLLEHLRAKTLPNIFAPAAALVSRYGDSILAIDVQTRTGDVARGTGFFAVLADSRSAQLFTCKHNVDPAEGISIQSITTSLGQKIDFGLPACHPTEDIAIIPVLGLTDVDPAFRFGSEPVIFDEVYTLGYPSIPGGEASVVGHRGEVNGSAKLFLGGSEVLLISNLVSPGSSGGPLLDRDGFCVGMSIKWLEGEWGGEKARFSAALPASLLKQRF